MKSPEQEELERSVALLSDIVDPLDSLSESNFTLVEAAKKEVQALAETYEELEDTDLDEDFKFVKDNFKRLITKANASLDDLLAIAKASEHPRAFEVLSSYINTIATINNGLIDLYAKKQKIAPASEEKEVQVLNQQNNQYVFNGSPTEVLKMLRGEK